ncbi:ferrous iron transporter FeoB [Anopheles sinensis]|uniref:Ferrous iron transporter FeoB n=1 Tax=Anopheles sinensis TaxID=74873 RepID=A0A084VTF3_ANOSI|nr:ferrous iron transporter FeoB [Anopheles sinensis]
MKSSGREKSDRNYCRKIMTSPGKGATGRNQTELGSRKSGNEPIHRFISEAEEIVSQVDGKRSGG